MDKTTPTGTYSFQPIKLVDVELSRPVEDLTGLDRYVAVRALVRLHGRPLGYVQVSTRNGGCRGTRLVAEAVRQLDYPHIRSQLGYLVAAAPHLARLDVAALLDSEPPPEAANSPFVTVAICTRDRTDSLRHCLEAVDQMTYGQLEILVVDNAPQSDDTRALIEADFPRVRYVCEDLPGLDNARNRALLEANGDIIAYTDDDVVVDANWAGALAAVFAADPDVTAVTGLVVPYELETAAQDIFEQYGGFGRGFARQWFRTDHLRPEDTAQRHGGTGKFGTGANMAFRRDFLLAIGGFDPALDVGTMTNGGGDLDAFFRTLKEGGTLVYEPAAVVRHIHRRQYDRLRAQIRNNGIGFYSFLVRNFLTYADERVPLLVLALWWFWWWNIRRVIGHFIRPYRIPRDLVWAELGGSLAGLTRYQRARRQAAAGSRTIERTRPWLRYRRWNVDRLLGRYDRDAVAIRLVDLAQPLQRLSDVERYANVSVYVTWHGHPLGEAKIQNDYHCVSALQLRDAIVDALGLGLLVSERKSDSELWVEIAAGIRRRYGLRSTPSAPVRRVRLDAAVPVSIVLATFDRPADLRACLESIGRQRTERPVEVVVVDNNPGSGVTPPVLADFPNVTYVAESRQGLSYARNAGIRASSGDIIICTDDDVVVTARWLERLVAPFADADVMVVTGNVLPLRIDTREQKWFEEYGGLGRGFYPYRVDAKWFEGFRFHPVPTWDLGATANAAFRATLFHDPNVGLLDECLGVGSPTGCSEDTMLFYQALHAGYTVAYEPRALVWHNHRDTYPALRKQLFGYSKGHVAYHLLTFRRYHDYRALFHVLFWLPVSHARRIAARLAGRTDFPLRLSLVEITGNLLGPVALLRSERRVRRLGRGGPYVPPAQRETSVTPAAVHADTRTAPWTAGPVMRSESASSS